MYYYKTFSCYYTILLFTLRHMTYPAYFIIYFSIFNFSMVLHVIHKIFKPHGVAHPTYDML